MLSQPAGKPAEAVAFTIVAGILEQLVAEVKVVAPLQSSFDGGGVGCVRQISNFELCPLPEGLLPTLETLT